MMHQHSWQLSRTSVSTTSKQQQNCTLGSYEPQSSCLLELQFTARWSFTLRWNGKPYHNGQLVTPLLGFWFVNLGFRGPDSALAPLLRSVTPLVSVELLPIDIPILLYKVGS